MAISAHDIVLIGFDHPYDLLEFDMDLHPNAHGRVKLKLRITEMPDMSRELAYGSQLTVCYSTADGDKDTLFCGILNHVALEKKGFYFELSLSLVTGSIALDRETKCAAYQDDTMTYSQVVTDVMAKSEGAAAIFTMDDESVTGGMLVQYQETDWAFIRRLASQLGEAVFPDWNTGSPKLYFGTALAGGRTDMELTDYSTFTTVLSQRFYDEGGFLAGLKKRDFLYYRISTGDNYDVGTQALILGVTRQILSKNAWLDGDQVMFTYDWGKAYPVKQEYNDPLTGAMLAGTVVETIDERVRLALDIDAVEPVIFHKWTPVTGNHFYCMPEVGTRTMIYFGNRMENSSKAVENVRENGYIQLRAKADGQAMGERKYGEKMLDNNNRYFASQDGKELSILPARIGLGPRDGSPKIMLEDSFGAVIDHLSLTLQAGGVVAFEGDMINIIAPSQVSMIRSGNGPSSTLNISKDFNVLGTTTSMRKTSKAAMHIPKSKVVEELKDEEIIKQAALSSIPLGNVQDSILHFNLQPLQQFEIATRIEKSNKPMMSDDIFSNWLNSNGEFKQAPLTRVNNKDVINNDSSSNIQSMESLVFSMIPSGK